MVAGEAVRVEAIEVVAAQLAIRLAVAEHVIRDHEDAVSYSDNGFLVAAPFDEPPVLGRQVAVAFADGAASTLDERRAQCPVGEAGAAARAGLHRDRREAVGRVLPIAILEARLSPARLRDVARREPTG